MSDQIIAVLSASPPRRVIGVAMLGALGWLLVYLGFSIPGGMTQFAMYLLGGIAVLAAWRLYSATRMVLELTETELRIKDGEVLARVSDMEKVERGAFAFKPSNGFLLTLKTPVQRRWAPGLFWAMGRRIGVGGVTGAPQSKVMAEAMSGLIALQPAPPEK